MNNEPESTPQEDLLRRRFSIKVLGVGGAGGNALGHMASCPQDGIDLVAINTDASALAQNPVTRRLVLGSRTFRGLGAGGDPERGRQAAEEDLDALRQLAEGADIVFVVAGLGGGTGTGASPVIARTAKEAGALVLSIVMLPFQCEGKRRQAQARQGLETLRQASDGVICLPNQKVFGLVDEHTSLIEAFKIINEFVAQGVRGIWRLLSQPGLINVDFADLCAVTKGRQASGALVAVEAAGENRVQELLVKLHCHPLSEEGQALARASAILISIAGGPDLSMKDVDRIMEHVNRQADQAHIIFGATIDTSLEQRLSLTLVASAHEAIPAETHVEAAPPPASAPATPPAAPAPSGNLESHLEELSSSGAASSRIVPPPPDIPEDKAQELYFERHAGRKRQGHRMRQGQLPLEIISRGRFEQSEPTLHAGEDLDVPTYIRRGVPLN